MLLCTDPVLAEKKYDPGASDAEIKIGQTMPYSGPLSAYSAVGRAELAYFAKVNAEGGINGRKITLISLDDGYNYARTVDQVRSPRGGLGFLVNQYPAAPAHLKTQL